VQRSQEVFHNPNIHKINLSVGSQSITGSTRMQCSTVLTYAIGLAILCKEDFINYATQSIKRVKEYYESIDAH
jgi:N-acetylmuramic acid 6-phosphate etherase